jgi:hypothetical protein
MADVDFNGSPAYPTEGDSIIVAYTDTLEFADTDEITVAAWINGHDDMNSCCFEIFSVTKSSNNSSNVMFRVRSQQLNFGYRNSANTAWHDFKSTSTYTWSSIGWTHVAVTYTYGTGSTAKLYINGSEVTSSWTSGTGDDAPADTSSGDGKIAIGASWEAGEPIYFATFDGQIADLAIWRATLTANEIAQLANSKLKRIPLQIQSSSLLSYWPLDDEEDGSDPNGDTFLDMVSGFNGSGSNISNSIDMTAKASEILSYP